MSTHFAAGVLKDAMLLTNTTPTELVHRSGLNEHKLIDYLCGHTQPTPEELNWILGFMGKAVRYELIDAEDPFSGKMKSKDARDAEAECSRQHSIALTDELRSIVRGKQQYLPF